ncbi:MAG: hypothetical protein BECKG1743F_GA0114225_109892 [Candidatus Kentron sp. G]|nr:MAG: hypothetical protein BECKG1743F_GA0114225_109892 [Candidatus Kentron sp. G]
MTIQCQYHWLLSLRGGRVTPFAEYNSALPGHPNYLFVLRARLCDNEFYPVPTGVETGNRRFFLSIAGGVTRLPLLLLDQ